MHRHTEASTAEETTDDPEGTVDATTEGEDMVTENPETGGTPGGRLETGRMEGGTTAATAGAPTTVTMTAEAAAPAAWSPEDRSMELRSTRGDRLFATTPEEVHRNDETPRQYE